MAKGARSNTKRHLHSWRRDNLKADWTEKAEKRRQEALQQVLEAPKPLTETSRDMQEEPQRGRAGPAEGGDTDMDGGGGNNNNSKAGSKKKTGRKGVKVAAGVNKKKRAGKAFLQGGNQFHKKGKKGIKRSHK
ncbi:hypothetical protein DUNSADRAFT_13879 [Dunaliella salina]|uniref:Uncharacterized protein n=1 Tax=Dunaliella salina TaxID=3046 RepID=A0ABQ7H2Z5_DUNSA|nr:hypothetical protein DUNSADRAFT_13879 [Dunaliella salina]|eukprot:KAF5841234.1 hypothetical protein DUNSADRAFT_13879 [Dunaliella salina]